MHKKICCAAGTAMLAALMALGLLSSDVTATELPDAASIEEAVEDVAKEVEVEDNVDETTLTIDVEDEELPEDMTPELSVADIINNSTVLTLNQVRDGDKFASKTDEKWYKFTISEAGYFRLVVGLGATADPSKINDGWKFGLYDSDDFTNPIKQLDSVKGDVTSQYYVLAKGNYYIKVNCNYYAPLNQAYKLKVEFTKNDHCVMEKNDSNSEASVINVNETYCGTMYNRSDNDWYKFTTASDGLLELNLGMNALADSSLINDGWNITLYDDKFNVIREHKNIKGKIESGLSSDLLPFKAGTYYIKIHPSYYGPFDQLYDLRVNFTASSEWEAEYNDTGSEATVMKANQNIKGLLYSNKDVDWFKLEIPRKTVANVDFTVAQETNADKIGSGWKLELYDGNQKLVKTYNNVMTTSSFDALELEAGTYYIKTSGYYSAPVACPYLLKVNCNDPANETLPQGPSTWERKSGVEGYVYRIYNVAMLREPEAGGAEYWENQLNTKAETASEVAKGFFFCEEFKSKNYSDAQFVRLLYRTIFGRDDTGDGLNYWLGLMENGMSREYVFKGFAESPEFTQLCQNYGVNRGNVTLAAYRDRNEGATGFIARLYTEMMARPYDEGGLEYWCGMYLTNSMSLDNIVFEGFTHSPEFKNLNLSNEEFVKRTYKTLLNRTAEGDGLNYWVKELQSGRETRDSIVTGFINSPEFGNLKASYGL